MNLRIRVPASTSNIGPGFDCFGMALTLYLDVEVRPAERLRITAENADVPLDETNLIVRTFLDAIGRPATPPPLSLHLVNRIPLTRGLGSSAAARVAGLTLASVFQRGAEDFDRDGIAQRAVALEKHPDNATPATYGGFCICAGEAGFERVEMNDRRYLLIVPEMEIETPKARASLPTQLSLADAVFNMQRAALGVARVTRRRELGALAPFADRLHQRYRLAIDPRLRDAFDALAKSPAIEALFLSGSGPTVFCLASDFGEARAAGQTCFDGVGLGVRMLEVSVDNRGVQVERIGFHRAGRQVPASPPTL
ncbi:MAG: homoserine kinase [Myxococcaceae bacterium]